MCVVVSKCVGVCMSEPGDGSDCGGEQIPVKIQTHERFKRTLFIRRR